MYEISRTHDRAQYMKSFCNPSTGRIKNNWIVYIFMIDKIFKEFNEKKNNEKIMLVHYSSIRYRKIMNHAPTAVWYLKLSDQIFY